MVALDLGGWSDKRKTILIVAALAAMVVFAVVAVIISLSGSRKMSEGWEEVHFLCQETGERFLVKYPELPREYVEKSAAGQMVFLDCPKCGKKSCAAPAIRCPNPECGKYYPRYYRDAAAGEVRLNVRCPHCRTVPHKWHREHKGG